MQILKHKLPVTFFLIMNQSGIAIQSVSCIESIQFHTEERYHTLLEQAPDVIRRVPLKYISSYLGITQQSLSRIRAT
jgi:hypothetical protein